MLPVIPTLKRQTKETQEFKTSLCYIVSSKLVWAIRDPVSKTTQGVYWRHSSVSRMCSACTESQDNAQHSTHQVWWCTPLISALNQLHHLNTAPEEGWHRDCETLMACSTRVQPIGVTMSELPAQRSLVCLPRAQHYVGTRKVYVTLKCEIGTTDGFGNQALQEVRAP